MNDTYHFLSSDKFYGFLIKEVDMLIGSYIRVAINIWFFIDDLSIIDHKNVSVFPYYHYSTSYTQNQSKRKENDL